MKKRKYTRTTNTNDNPFKIEEGVVFTGNRGSNIHADMLIEQMLKLPVDKNKSIAIPLGICKTKNEASNLFLAAKRRVALVNRSAYYTMKTVYSVDKKSYLGARIWRLQ